MIELCVIFFWVTLITFLIYLIKLVIDDWKFFKQVIVIILKGAALAIPMSIFIIGGSNAMFYNVSKLYEYVKSLF